MPDPENPSQVNASFDRLEASQLEIYAKELAEHFQRERRLRQELAKRNQELENRLRELDVLNQELEHSLAWANEMTRSAEAANVAKREFLANMSHEVRTPLNGILGALDLMSDAEPTVEQVELLGMASESARSLLSLLNGVLDISKIEAGKLELSSERFDLRETVRNAVALLRLQAEAKGLRVELVLAEDLPQWAQGDPVRLRQIISNLVNNAVRFTDEGAITVLLEPKGTSRLHLCVTDTGAGIPHEKQEAIFDAFVQVDGSSTRSHGGSGLGLAIVSQLVTLMGGRVWVESEPGEGSAFHVEVRMESAQAPASAPERRMETAEFTHALRVLVADDNRVNLRVAQGLLVRAGHEVETVSSGEDALARALEGGFDVLLMDVQMPGMDGLTATQRLREAEAATGGHLPVVGVSASAMPEDKARCLACGMDAYVAKPLNVAELLSVLGRVTGGQQVVDSAAALARLGGDVSLLREAAGAFVHEGPRMTSMLVDAASVGDTEAIARAAHTLAGAAGVFGAEELVEQAVALESAARLGHGSWKAQVDAVVKHTSDLLAVLRPLAA